MAFSEKTKLEVKRRAHFRCCLCRNIGVEIHHIIPSEEDGPNTEENAAPLCPSCHETWGGNTKKRKFIREARDFWYEHCEKELVLDAKLLDEMLNIMQQMPTKDDLLIARTEIVSSLRHNESESDLEDILYAWASSVERDECLEGNHIDRVSRMCTLLGKQVGITGENLRHLKWGSILHDIGKSIIPDSILLKLGKLDLNEWELLKQHTIEGYNTILAVPVLRPVATIPYCHHERWDGQGYPRGLAGDMIPIEARVFTIIDMWDAFTTKRPYKSAWSVDKAVEIMKEQQGIIFDPDLFTIFADNLEKIIIFGNGRD